MNLVTLKRFLAVAEAGSLNKAADRLNLSQPALSKAVQLLEERLGVELLSRGSRGVQLTTFGETVVQRARVIEAEVRRLEGEIEALRSLSFGEVHAGVAPGPGFQSQVLPAATERLTAGNRRLTIHYTMGNREQLLPLLRQGALDFIIATIVEGEAADGLTQQPLFRDRHAIVVPADHPLRDRDRVSCDDLVQYRWVVQSESAQQEKALRALAHANGTPMMKSVVHSDSSQFVKMLLRSSDAIGLLRVDIVRVEAAAGIFKELSVDAVAQGTLDLGSHVIGVVHRRDAPVSTASLALMAEIRAECLRAEYF